MIADAAARMHDHASALGSTATAAVELAGADGRVGDIPPIVDVALDRILPRFARDAADLVASAVGALADLAPQDGLRSASNRLEDIDHRVDGWRAQVETVCTPTVLDRIPDLAPRLQLIRTEQARLRGQSPLPRWAELVRAWDRLDARYDGSYARRRLAEALLVGPAGRSADARAEARTLLSDARRSAAGMGAVPLVTAIDTLARRAHLTLDAQPAGHRPAATSHADPGFGLTEREGEVLRLVIDGYSNGQIGQALFISRKTASVHVSNILRKLGVSSRLQAATIARKSG